MKFSPDKGAASAPTVSWKQRYETLRQLMTGGSQIAGTEPLGLVLLLRQGMARWMRSWPEAIPAQTTTILPDPALIVPTSQWQQQLTALLAQMTLSQFSCTIRL
jgi:hypothetical protein